MLEPKSQIILNTKKCPQLVTNIPTQLQEFFFNYNKTVSTFDQSTFDDMECDCSSSPFCYTPHNHIITGNLNIIKNDKLKELVKKGPKYREQNKISWKKAKKHILDGVENYGKAWAKKEKVDVSALKEWVNIVKIMVESKIKKYRRTHFNQNPKVLDDPIVKKYLEDLHKTYVLVPADKAANNIIVICKSIIILS